MLGFALGCCGLLIAGLFGRKYLPGAAVGLLLQIAASAVGSALLSFEETGFEKIAGGVPWDLVLAFGFVTVSVVIVTAAGFWAFGNRDDEDDDDDEPNAPPPKQGPTSYVTFTRD